MSITLRLLILLSLVACDQQYHAEFSMLKPELSNHFTYTLSHSELRPLKNCKSYHFEVVGVARDPLRIKDRERVFINTSAGLPNALNEMSFNRVKEARLQELRTRGIKEHCLEVKEFECTKYQFRDPSESDLLGMTQQLDDEYPINLSRGQAIFNRIQMKICPQQEIEVSYLVQLP